MNLALSVHRRTCLDKNNDMTKMFLLLLCLSIVSSLMADNEVEQLKGTIGSQPQVVAFSAWLDHDVSLGEHQAIEYNRVLTNLGGAYDVRHGHFTAPVRGIYIISATALNYREYETHIEIVKNGVQLAELFGQFDVLSQSSQTLVLELQANDMVWVRHFMYTSSIKLWGRPNQPLNTFSGVLLAQIY